MSGKVPGLLLFAVGLAAVFAGYYLVAVVVIGIGVLLVATGSGSGRRRGAVAGSSRPGFDAGTSYYGDSSASSNDALHGGDHCHAGNDGGGYSDSGGDCGGGGD